MKLSDELEYWAKFATMSDKGRKQHGEMAFKANQLEAWIRWILHLHHDVGKDDGPPKDAEWKQCLNEGMRLMNDN